MLDLETRYEKITVETNTVMEKVGIALDPTLLDNKLKQLRKELGEEITNVGNANFTLRNHWQ